MEFLCLYKFIYLFLAELVFVAVCGLSLVVLNGGYSLLWSTGSSFPCLLLLQSPGSRGYRLSSCGTPDLLPHSMWDLTGSGTEPISPALEGGFFPESPGNPRIFIFEDSTLNFISFAFLDQLKTWTNKQMKNHHPSSPNPEVTLTWLDLSQM